MLADTEKYKVSQERKKVYKFLYEQMYREDYNGWNAK